MGGGAGGGERGIRMNHGAFPWGGFHFVTAEAPVARAPPVDGPRPQQLPAGAVPPAPLHRFVRLRTARKARKPLRLRTARKDDFPHLRTPSLEHEWSLAGAGPGPFVVADDLPVAPAWSLLLRPALRGPWLRDRAGYGRGPDPWARDRLACAIFAEEGLEEAPADSSRRSST